jgi:hypothetical protein
MLVLIRTFLNPLLDLEAIKEYNLKELEVEGEVKGVNFSINQHGNIDEGQKGTSSLILEPK